MRNDRNGFTLIELIFTLVILGIVISVIIPDTVQKHTEGTIVEGISEVGADIRNELEKSEKESVSEQQNQANTLESELKVSKEYSRKLEEQLLSCQQTRESLELKLKSLKEPETDYSQADSSIDYDFSSPGSY